MTRVNSEQVEESGAGGAEAVMHSRLVIAFIAMLSAGAGFALSWLAQSDDSETEAKALAGASDSTTIETSSSVTKPPRPAREILREFSSERGPSVSNGGSPDAMAAFRAAHARIARRQGELALELFEAYPDYDAVPRVMRRRWEGMINVLEEYETALEEAREILRDDPLPGLEREARFAAASALLHLDMGSFEEKKRAVEEAVTTAPSDVRVTLLLMRLAFEHTADPAFQRDVLKRIDTGDRRLGFSGANALVLEHLVGRLGSRVELEFDDAVSGAATSTVDLRPSFVLIYFWAAREDKEVPGAARTLSSFHETYGPRGLEMIGVHEGDRASREAVVQFARGHDIDWPQYGDPEKYADALGYREFGVMGGRLAVLLDREGRLAAFTRRPERLRSILEELLGATDAASAFVDDPRR